MEDTIAAIATALGEGGIGIVRISGNKAEDILRDIFIPSDETAGLYQRKMTYGWVFDRENNETIDEAMAVLMKAPKTYTTEDVAEINCHGSMISLRRTLELVLRRGARLSEPGEFTKRAFLNGRIDLSQAEAVIDMIKAKTDSGFDIAISQLDGALSRKVHELRKSLLDILVDITVNIDYPDEDIEEITYGNLSRSIEAVRNDILSLLDTAHSGRLIKEGIRVAIVGRPNVGKSSLMNSLLRENRAIVTDIPGTTRDTIEEAVNIHGIPVYLVDTAGMRETSDKVEKIGIEKSKEAFNKADLIIFILDGSTDMTDEDKNIMDAIGEKKHIILINKSDLGCKIGKRNFEEVLKPEIIINSSVVEGSGIEELEAAIHDMVYDGRVCQNESIMINNVRHINLLENAEHSLAAAANMISMSEALDFVEVDVRSSYDMLGEIIGETVSDDIINEVFSRFCLGK